MVSVVKDNVVEAYFVEHLFLDEDGELFWKATGKLATYPHGKYLRVSKWKCLYYAHHIVWRLTCGYWPTQIIDHKNGDGHNNRPTNLREASHTGNVGNSHWGPLRGVEKHGRKWRARITTDNGKIELGSYDTVEEAQQAYVAGAEKHFGEFAFHNRSMQ